MDLMFRHGKTPTQRLMWLKKLTGGGGGGGSTTKTVTGTLLHILDALAKPAVSFEVGIEPQQSGSGDPSPDNVRPITGWTGVDVYRSGADTSNPTTIPITFPASAGTVYGGTLDVTTGVLTVTHRLWKANTSTMNNSENYPGWKNSGIAAMVGSEINKRFDDQIMSVGTSFSVNTTLTNANDILFLPTAYYDGRKQSSWISLAVDVEIAVPLATPQTYQLTPQQVTLLLGENNIWADGNGTLSLTYKAQA